MSRFLYILFIAIDACFRLKRRLISSELKDPSLAPGWAYMLEAMRYRKYLLTVTDQKEVSFTPVFRDFEDLIIGSDR